MFFLCFFYKKITKNNKKNMFFWNPIYKWAPKNGQKSIILVKYISYLSVSFSNFKKPIDISCFFSVFYKKIYKKITKKTCFFQILFTNGPLKSVKKIMFFWQKNMFFPNSQKGHLKSCVFFVFFVFFYKKKHVFFEKQV